MKTLILCAILFISVGTAFGQQSPRPDGSIEVAAEDSVITLGKNYTPPFTGVNYSPDGSRIATSSEDSTAKIWDADAGTVLLTLKGHTDVVSAVSFGPDGLIATASKDGTAKIWDATTGALIRTLTGHSGALTGISFSSDGSRIATSSEDSTAKIWDVATGTLIRTLFGHKDVVRSVSCSPDGSLNLEGALIATVSNDNTAKIWDASTGVLLRTLSGPNGHLSDVKSVSFRCDGRRVVTTGVDGVAKIWETNTGYLRQTLSEKLHRWISSASYSPTKLNLILITEGEIAIILNMPDPYFASEDTIIRFVSLHTSVVFGAYFSPNSNHFVTVGNDHSVKIWDANTGYLTQMLTSGHLSTIKRATFSPDGSRIATLSNDGINKIWNATTGALVRTLVVSKVRYNFCFAFQS